MRSGETAPGLFQQKSSSPGLEPDGFSQRTAPPARPDYAQPEQYADAAAASQTPVKAHDPDVVEDAGKIEKVEPTQKPKHMYLRKHAMRKGEGSDYGGITALHFTDKKRSTVY